MNTNTYNCINIDTYTYIYPILVAGRVLALTHLTAKDNFEVAHLVLVIVVTLCVIVRANTGTNTTCCDTTTVAQQDWLRHSEAAMPSAACVPSFAASTSPEAPTQLT